MATTPQEVARRWLDEHGYVERGGVVVMFDGSVQSWGNELRDPEHWQTGCVAVDEQGRTWAALSGDDRNGARTWVPTIACK
ncbi:hypothetical protein [Burkholderia pseudomallei]|uniref:hypothetical protein n=1 Tax=Burkholderia pseudomallei TaxID=28450 RepID=UPI0009781382|nr:hypothetical protein [Burkholderia pseudomallei]MBM5581028.1 hypothetical protein [Burkholderia pseudomallei]MBM5587501.1 hypothetical protein [Burkholderia pseudomallei]MBM5620710.1 hypothetical protein [Burkholderia pseudomallei]MBM5634211.1 hypothetical protein [Burkholderia pseudomallei]MBM5662515.1 hypothetical protein [Burkholderia pseudomallei]